MNIGIHPNEIARMKTCIDNFSNVEKAILFGSRAKGNHKYNSDIDLALAGEISELECERIKTALEELPLAYSFDVLVYNQLKNINLKEHIDRVGIDLGEI